ncbi:MAG: hypothetical protein R3B95_11525 [Nitrospirales bacterium]|nr:hypothetical protein [Nitrospirales bacterium]
MSADVQNFTGYDGETSQSSHSFTHDSSGGGSNLAIVVGVGRYTSGGRAVTGITYGGDALTLVRTLANGDEGVDIYARANITPGASQQVVITLNGSGNIGAFALTAHTINQATPVGDSDQITAGSDPAVTLDSEDGDLAVDIWEKWANSGTVNGGQTQIYQGTTTDTAVGASYKPATGSTVSMGWSGVGSAFAYVALVLKQAAGGPIVQAIGQAAESALAQLITYVFAVLADQAEETDTALPMIAPIIRAVGVATEADAVQPIVRVNPDLITGLDFPDNDTIDNGDTVRFKWTNPHSNGLPIYGTPVTGGITYIWRYYPRQQAGYYTTFFWGNDDGVGDLSTFLWDGGGANSYYGAHPYPNPPPSGTAHDWEISVEQADYTNGTVEYNRWHIQALRVWEDASGNKHHEFYWDLPFTDSGHMVSRTSPSDWGNTNPPSPALTWGDAPWQPGNELGHGIHRGIQIYSDLLSLSEILEEIADPLSSAKSGDIWYLNLNPTLTDISDKSGNGNDPAWVGALRPTLYSALAKTIGIATETETAQALIQPHIVLLGLNAESENALSIAVKKQQAIGQSDDTETAQVLSVLKQQSIGLNTENESVQTITARKAKTVGLSAETENIFGMGATKVKAVGLLAETGLAQALTLQDATLVGQTAETDSAQAITSHKTLVVGLTQEPNSGLSVRTIKIKPIGIATETDQSFNASSSKVQSVALVTETNLSQGVAAQGTTLLEQSTESDVALSFAAQKSRHLGMTVSTEISQAQTPHKVRTIEIVQETNAAQGMGTTHTLLQVVETDTGLPIRVIKTRALGFQQESGQAFDLSHAKLRTVGILHEVDVAFGVRTTGALQVTSEDDAALSVTANKTSTVGLSLESQEPFSIHGNKSRVLGLQSEADQALSVLGLGGYTPGTEPVLTVAVHERDVSARVARRELTIKV